MRHIANATYMSLDGVVQHPELWTFDYRSDDAAQVSHDQLFAADALIMGRHTYDIFAGHWPAATDPDERYTHHTLYIDPGGQFSILAIVWRPGQHTRIHDHVTWCAFGVLQGVEDEELFDADLNLVGRNVNRAGDVSGFAPPGDIHRMTNTGDVTAISIHVYGTDVSRIGSSVRRYY